MADFLYILWASCIAPAGEVADGIQNPHRSLGLGWSPHEHAKDSEHGVPSMLQPWWIFGFGIHATCDRGWTLIPIEADAAGTVTGV